MTFLVPLEKLFACRGSLLSRLARVLMGLVLTLATTGLAPLLAVGEGEGGVEEVTSLYCASSSSRLAHRKSAVGRLAIERHAGASSAAVSIDPPRDTHRLTAGVAARLRC